jgi:hypothetical protein
MVSICPLFREQHQRILSLKGFYAIRGFLNRAGGALAGRASDGGADVGASG